MWCEASDGNSPFKRTVRIPFRCPYHADVLRYRAEHVRRGSMQRET